MKNDKKRVGGESSGLLTGLHYALCGILLLYLAGLAVNQWKPELFDNQDNSNRFRNALELLYFLTSSFIVFVAWHAISFAKRQSEEAEKARLASVYIEVGNRWFNSPVLDSRVIIGETGLTFEQTLAASYPDPATRQLKRQEYFASTLGNMLQTGQIEAYAKAMAMINFFEDVGLMVRRGYLRCDDIQLLLGTAVVTAHRDMAKHLDDRRQAAQAPTMYEHFEWLAKEFVRRPKPDPDA